VDALQFHGYLVAEKEKLANSTFTLRRFISRSADRRTLQISDAEFQLRDAPSHCVASILIFNP
jgi:hypothetical protein